MNYSVSPALPIEFRLAVACCHSAFASDAEEEVWACANSVHWDRFVTVAGRHRIEGLAWHSLDRLRIPLPPETAQRLAARARSIADHGLRSAAESAMLLGAFEKAGVDLIFVKGVTLGKLAYPSPFLKMSWDIDLLVAPDRIFEAAVLLDAHGYRCTIPGDGRPLRDWHLRRKESVWSHAGKGLHVELHGRLPENPALIPGIGLGSARQQVEVAPGIVLPTLARDELFAYLSVHGALSGWHRLKWLSDLAALIQASDEAEIARLYSRSQALGAGRAAGQALLLADLLFRIGIGSALKRQLTADRETRWLVAIALRQLVGRADLRDLTEVRFGTAMIHASHLLLAPGWSAKMRELGRKTGEIVRNAAGRTTGAE